MRAMAIVPKQAQTAALIEVAEPDEADGSLLIETIAVGICGGGLIVPAVSID